MVVKNNERRAARAAQGIKEMKHHRVPSLKAFLTASCAVGDSEVMLWMELKPLDDAEAMDSASDGERLPDLMRLVMKEVTLPSRTAPHWARPTVPPNERNCDVRGRCELGKIESRVR